MFVSAHHAVSLTVRLVIFHCMQLGIGPVRIYVQSGLDINIAQDLGKAMTYP